MTTPPPPTPTARVWTAQPPAAALLAQVLTHAATELFDAAALHDPAWMWEEARAIASRILASCPNN
jgi:hypothetical protein